MSVKTAGVGHFQIPTAPAAGTSVTSGAANALTASAVQLIASTAAALYITGVHAEAAAASGATYKLVQLMIGAGGAETVLGQYLVPMSTGSTVALGYRPIFPPIPVASGQRISVKTADSVGSQATLITIECIAQSNVVDDGITVGTVNLVNTTTTVTNQLTAAAIATGVWQDATAGDFTVGSSIGKALYIANIAPGAAGGHFISGSNAGTTTFGALTVTGAATLSITGNLSGSVGSVTGAVGSVTGNVGGNVTGSVGSVVGAVGSVTGLVVGNLDVAVSTRLATAGYTVPPTAVQNRQEMDTNSTGLAAIFARTDVATSTRAATGAAMTLTAGERTSVADALLNRNVAGGSSAGRLVKDSLAFLRNKWTLAGDTLTVYDTDDVTVLWTATVARTAGDPISSSDPA